MSGYHLIVLAKNYNGYKNLIKLVSNSWVDGYYMRPRTDNADLEKYHEDLIVCSACIAGEVPSKILHGDLEGAREACQWYHNLFGDDYYLELQRHKVPDDPSLLANREAYELQQRANKEPSRWQGSLTSSWCAPTTATSRIRRLPRPTTICSVSLPARISTTLTVCAIPSRNGSRPARR